MTSTWIQSAAIFLGLAVTPASAVECANKEPAEVAQSFFRSHYLFLSEKEPADSLSTTLAKLVARELACREQGQVCAVDWDFWTSAQDGDVEGAAKSRLVLQRRDLAKVNLRYSFRPTPDSKATSLRAGVLLVRESDGCWRIDDIHRDGKSLKRLLAAAPDPS